MNSSSTGESLEIKIEPGEIEPDQDAFDNSEWNHQNKPEDFIKCEVGDKVENLIEIDPSHIKAETEDNNEDFNNCNQFMFNPNDIRLLEKGYDQSKRFVFQRGDLIFEELPDGKVQCGSCMKSFARILGHLTNNPTCALNIDFSEFKTLWSKYKNKQNTAKYEQRKRSQNPEQFLRDQAERKRKYEQKKKAENPEQFLKDQAERTRKYVQRKKAENLEQFLKDQAERTRRYVQKKKGENLDHFLTYQNDKSLEYQEKKRTENPCQFLKDQAERQRRYAQKKKAQNPEEFLRNQAERQRKYAQKKRAENPELFLKEQAMRRRKYNEKLKANNSGMVMHSFFSSDNGENASFHDFDTLYHGNTIWPDENPKPKELCPQCGSCFRNLQQHITQIHQSVKNDQPSECDLCKKTFSSKSHLKVHMKTIHDGERNYTCQFCDRAFSIKSHLKRHIMCTHQDAASEDSLEKLEADVKHFETYVGENFATNPVEKLEVEVDPIVDFEEDSYENVKEDENFKTNVVKTPELETNDVIIIERGEADAVKSLGSVKIIEGDVVKNLHFNPVEVFKNIEANGSENL